MRRGIDYSGGRPGGQAIADAGYRFVMRYLWPFTPKGADADEIADLRAHGLAVGFVYEQNETRALTAGYQGGRDDARYARQRATDLGAPADVALYFAVDTNVGPTDWPALDEYFRGINAQLPRATVGAYAEKQYADHLRSRGLAAWFWYPAASSWSDYQPDPEAHIRQLADGGAVNGVGIDPNEADGPAGLWEPEEDEMDPTKVTELAIRTATVLFGWSDGTDFKDVDEALARAKEMTDGNVLCLVRIDDLRDQVTALTAEVDRLAASSGDPTISAALADIHAKLAAIGEVLAPANKAAPGGNP